MTGSIPCKGSGRLVSEARKKSAVYASNGWVTWCPYHQGPAPFALAEPTYTRGGYARRYKDHSSTKETT